MPVRLILTQGTTADCSQAIALIQGIQAHLLADKGDSNEIVTAALLGQRYQPSDSTEKQS